MASINIIGGNLPNIPWQEKPANAHEPMWRHAQNPIIGWNPTKTSGRIFNSGVVPYGDGFTGIFRGDRTCIFPQLFFGTSKDAIHWDIEDDYIKWVDENGDAYQPRYAYDPRLLELDGVYYIIWCTDFSGPALGLGRTTDFKTFTRLDNPFFPFNRNGVLFPRKINGNYVLLSRPSDNGHTPFGDIFVSESPDLVYWGKHRKVMSVSGNSWWQSTKIGAGPIPIETDKGWLLFYHGVVNTCNGFVYSFGAALLDTDTPSKVLLRGDAPLISPQMDYETVGFVPNVCFPCAALSDAATGRIAVYYGAADSTIAVAYTTADEIYHWLLENNELVDGDAKEWK